MKNSGSAYVLAAKMKRSKWLTLVFIVASIGGLILIFSAIGTEIFPKTDAGQAQVRLRLPTGTRIERTETATQKHTGYR